MRGKDFPLDQPGAGGSVTGERSPFGFDLDIRYPKAVADVLVKQAQDALESWRDAGPRAWVGVSLEILKRLNQRSFEIAQAVQRIDEALRRAAADAGPRHDGGQ